jgi:SAM-dependent methyltransferase
MRRPAAIPERIRWAIELLDLQPDDRVLDIGPGPGVSVAAIAERLSTGTVTALDRSATAIEATRQRNAAAISAGRVATQLVPIERASFPNGAFTKVLAVNVNLFWVRDASRELALIRRLLLPDGRLYLIYEPPSADRLAEIERRLSAALTASGYAVDVRTAERAGRALLGVIGRMRE